MNSLLLYHLSKTFCIRQWIVQELQYIILTQRAEQKIWNGIFFFVICGLTDMKIDALVSKCTSRCYDILLWHIHIWRTFRRDCGIYAENKDCKWPQRIFKIGISTRAAWLWLKRLIYIPNDFVRCHTANLKLNCTQSWFVENRADLLFIYHSLHFCKKILLVTKT